MRMNPSRVCVVLVVLFLTCLVQPVFSVKMGQVCDPTEPVPCDDNNTCTQKFCDTRISPPRCAYGEPRFFEGNASPCFDTTVAICQYRTCVPVKDTNISSPTYNETINSTCTLVNITGVPAAGCAGPAEESCTEYYCNATMACGSPKADLPCCTARIVTPCCHVNNACEPLYQETTSNCCDDCPCGGGQFCINRECTNLSSSILSTTLTEAQWKSWLPLVLAALLVGYLVVALLLMASSILHSPELNAHARREFVEVSASAWFVGNIIFFAVVLDILLMDVAGGSYMQTADQYTSRLSVELLNAFGKMVKAEFGIGLLQYLGGKTPTFGTSEAYAGTITPPFVTILIVTIAARLSFSPFYGMSILANLIGTGANFISFALFSVIGQKVLLQFVAETGFRIFLPIGVVLRCFTLTRRLGATIMAFAVGMYIVYPTTLVMNNEIYNSVAPLPKTEYWGSLPFKLLDFNELTKPFFGPRFKDFCKHWYDYPWCWIRALVQWVWDMIEGFFRIIGFMLAAVAGIFYPGVGKMAQSGFDQYADMMPWMMQPIVAAFLFPVLDFIVVITAIRSLSVALGGEVRITGLAEFI